MSEVPYVTAAAAEPLLTWSAMVAALEAGHRLSLPELGDIYLEQAPNGILNRGAWIAGLGIALKAVTIFPGNPSAEPPLPSIQGITILFDHETGATKALLDGALVTKWKTAADSVLGARLLARADARTLLIVGSGTVARSLVEAYDALFPGLERIDVWSRTADHAQRLAASYAELDRPVRAIADLAAGAGAADIIATATLARAPILHGDWVRPGTHVDLIGAFTPEMREADDALIAKSALFVDARATTIEHIGELMTPIAAGVITAADVRGDLYDLVAGRTGRSDATAITVFKNGGGAHLDLMTADLIFRTWQRAQSGG